MKAVILAGGLGTRISEETGIRPKPMVEIGSEPILWHIMKIFSHHGINDFIICGGYKAGVIKEYFRDYVLRNSDLAFNMQENRIEFYSRTVEPWHVKVIDTGLNTMTGGRLRRVREYLGDEPFCMTYGDGVSSVDISALVDFHRDHGKLATLTAVQPTGRFGTILLSENDPSVHTFVEKPKGDGAWINGGFFVLDPAVLDYVEGDDTIWEHGPMNRLAHEGQLMAYRHAGFWHPMDTLRDKTVLTELWNKGEAPWKAWAG